MQLVIAACDKLEKEKNVNCESDYVSNCQVLVREGGSGYVVEFRHVPPRGFDDGFLIYVSKKTGG